MNWKAVLIRLGLVVGSLGFTFLMIAFVINIFPELLPAELREDPLDQRIANDEYRFVFTDEDGDTFRVQAGQVRPPEENRILEDFTRRYGADGFRIPAMPADEYAIIALGDSFTEGGQVPWVDVLAQELETPVRNLGWPGIGPLDYARIMDEFGQDNHDWVLIGYFEGNDLGNIQSAFQREQEDRNILFEIAERAGETVSDNEPEIVLDPNGNYLYPLRHTVGDQTFELAYISDYIWWLNGDADAYRQSRNLELLREALADIQADAGSACVGLVYIPNKGHIYFQYSDPAGNQIYVLQNGKSLRLQSDGWLGFDGLEVVDYGTLMDNIDNQRDVVRELTGQVGLHFIDLTPAFQAAASGGEQNYYIYDSHWSQAGHNLAGETVADYIRATPDCP